MDNIDTAYHVWKYTTISKLWEPNACRTCYKDIPMDAWTNEITWRYSGPRFVTSYYHTACAIVDPSGRIWSEDEARQ